MNGFEEFAEESFSLPGISARPEALKGIRVIELATRIFGPVTSDYLAEFGAEVIKVELPLRGDLMRYVAPEGFFWKEVSPAFLSLNRNKFHVAVDVRLPEGADLFARLGIDLPLLYGDTVRDTVLGSTPNGAAFLLPSTIPPGSGGNSYIYAHARAGMFLTLWDIRLGDVVEVTAPSGEARRYVVTEVHPRVVPTDVRYTLPSADERITLQTSTGPHDADPRFIAIAVRMG